MSKKERKAMGEAPQPLATAASTHTDRKAARHILPRQHDGGAAFCGLEAGFWGWENQNAITFADGPGYCPLCLDVFRELRMGGVG